jgi:hypothetical protein
MTWTSVYKHNENGAPISGGKTALINNVERGIAVRIAYIVYEGHDPNVYRRAVLDANPVFSAFGEVHAQAAWNSVDFSNEEDYLTFPQPNTTYLLNLSTSGKVNRRTVTANGTVNDDLSSRTLEWFCDL